MNTMPRPNVRRPVGFTLVELLVVIAIIGILVALLLPAVQAAREAARRSSCQNNLRQVLISVHNYESAFERFPSGSSNPTGPIQNLPNGDHKSWIVRILPYMGEQVRYRSADLSVGAYHKANNTVRQSTIELLKCPSSYADDYPYSSYAGVHHHLEAPIDTTNTGVLFLNSQLRFEELLDGAGYTLLLGEKMPDGRTDLGWMSGTPATLRNVGTPLNEGKGQQDSDGWNRAEAPPWSDAYEPFYSGDYGYVDPDEEVDSKEADTDDPIDPFIASGGDPDNPLLVGGFGSAHPGGCQFAKADGSVLFISEDADPLWLEQIANRADGKMIDSLDW